MATNTTTNIKPTSTVRTVVVTTARATTKAARATVAGALRMTATTATMTPNCDKDNDDGILFAGARVPGSTTSS